MSSRHIRPVAAATALLMLLAGCGGHATAAKSPSAARAASASASSSASAAVLSTANIYDRVLHATGYAGLHGSIVLTETAGGETVQLTGSFATYLADFGGHSSELKLQLASMPSVSFTVRAIDKTIYFRQGVGPWKDVTTIGRPNYTTEMAGQRDLSAQMLAGLDPLEYTNLLEGATGLRQVPSASGTSSFTGTDDVEHTGSAASQYSFGLIPGYEKEGITSDTFTATFDSQARPVALREHFPSTKLTIDYHLTVTGYTAAKVTAPI